MKDPTKIESFELVKDNGHEVIFDIIEKEMKRDIYPSLFRDGFRIGNVPYEFAGFSRVDSPGKCRYWGKKKYPKLKIIISELNQ